MKKITYIFIFIIFCLIVKSSFAEGPDPKKVEELLDQLDELEKTINSQGEKKEKESKNSGILPETNAEYYNVTNVKNDDVLNVRQKPNPSSSLMGAISYNGKCLKYLSESKNYEGMLWKKIEYPSHDGAIVGWVNTYYLSPTNKCESIISNKNKNLRNSSNFETFLNYFLNTCYWDKSINTLVQKSSPEITQFYSREIPFGIYWNNGAACRLYTDSYDNVPTLEKNTLKNPNFKVFKEKKPKDGFCEESPSPKGIYIMSVSEFPPYHKDIFDKKGNFVNTVFEKYQVPPKYRNSKKYLVMILYEKFIKKSMYFIQINGIWYLVSFDDCDCSA